MPSSRHRYHLREAKSILPTFHSLNEKVDSTLPTISALDEKVTSYTEKIDRSIEAMQVKEKTMEPDKKVKPTHLEKGADSSIQC